MKSSNKEKAVFRYLLTKSIDGQITDSETQQLNALLSTYPDIEQYYFKNILLQFALSEAQVAEKYHLIEEPILGDQFWAEMSEYEKTAPAIEIPKEKPKREPVKMLKIEKAPRVINKFSLYTAIISTAALIFILVGVRFIPLPASSVATITDSANAQWGQDKHPTEIGSALWDNEGPRWLHEGLVKIEFDYGAEVIIEGPARFELEDTDKMLLHTGRLYAVVPGEATGFIVETPYSTVIDLGTEFGVKVDVDGTTDVHMIKGRASLVPGADGQKGKSHDLVAGQAARVLRDDLTVRTIPLRQRGFATYIPSPYERYAKSLKPFNYLRFDQKARSPLTDLIQTEGLKSQFKGEVSWVDGPDLGEGKTCSAVQFSGTDTDGISVELPLMSEKNGFTYSLWVRPEVIGESAIIVMPKKIPGIFREIGLDADGHFLQCASRGGMGGVRGIINPLVGKTVARPGQWYHVVVTINWGQKKRLYVNGALEGLSEQKVGAFVEGEYFNRFYIGGFSEESLAGDFDDFQGAICEVMVFDRILSGSEVLNLYQSGGMPAVKLGVGYIQIET
jgi:hypothetical protein